MNRGGPRLKHRVRNGDRECCRRAGGNEVVQNGEETLKDPELHVFYRPPWFYAAVSEN